MTLPHSYGLVLMLTILTMICWGSWANVLKLAKGWRFELLYYDYSIGVALGAALAGLTFGTWGSDGLQFLDDLAHAGNTNILCGFLGGVIFNLSNILVVGAISVAGMGVAFPIGVGLALVVGVIWNYIVNPQGNPWLLFIGVALIVGAIVVDAIAYRAHAVSRSTDSHANGLGAAGFAIIGGMAGGLVGYLVGKPPLLSFGDVLSRGTTLTGLGILLRPAAETAFNWMLAGVVVGVAAGFAMVYLKSPGSAPQPAADTPSNASDRIEADAAARRAATWKGIRLSIVGGILMGMFYPLVEIGKTGEKGLGPYAVGFVFGLGVLASVFVFNLYFMRFPIDGPRLSFGDYLRGNWWVHFLGIVGGMAWIAGSLSNFVAASAPRELQVGPAISYAIGQGSTMVGALWGVVVWKEFAGGGARVNDLLVLMFALFLAGLGLVSMAPLYAVQ